MLFSASSEGAHPSGSDRAFCPTARHVDLPFQKIAEINSRRSQLLRQERGDRQAGKRVQLQKVEPIVGGDDIGARVTVASEDFVSGDGNLLRFLACAIGNLRRTDFSRAFAQVLAGVVERG